MILSRISAPATRRSVLALALPLLATAVCAVNTVPAQAGIGIEIEIAPPAPRFERVPPPRAGWAWAPGYYRWEGRRHVWEPGHWEHDRPGHHWIAAHWVPGEHGHYRFEEGHWD
jgi:hypothetical protein